MILSAKALEAIGTGRLEAAGENRLFHLLTGALDRKVYVEVNKALEAMGGKWSRKEKAHVFDSDPADAIDLAICSGEVDAPADRLKAAGYFPTPDALAQRLVVAAKVMPGNLVLEPSAGRGNLVKRIAAAGGIAYCYELLPENATILEGLLASLGTLDGKAHSLLGTKDFLDASPGADFDRVVMNPPFGKSSDAKHVLHALKFLRPGGRLAGICSAGVKYRNGKVYEDFRAAMTSIEDLPEGSFKESGTMTHTVLVTAEKKR